MDNFDKLLEAIEHPERFSDSELQTLLSDPEARRLYRVMCAPQAEAYVREDKIDGKEIGRQWKRFCNARRKTRFFSWLRSRKAAAVAAFLIASGSIVVVGVSLTGRSTSSPEQNYKTVTETAVVAEESTLPSILSANDTVIIFEDEKLDRILAEIAPYYNAKVDLKSPESREVRLFLKWESTMTLPDLIEHLNSFDRINLHLQDDTITDY